MPEIRIRHCRLRVVRHGGWSWGADPRRLVDQVTERLPAWIAQALAEQLAGCPPDLTLPQLRVRIPVRMSELRDWPAAREAESGEAGSGALAHRARMILAAALQDIPRVPLQTSPTPLAAEAERGATDDEVSLTTVVDTLTAWQRAGDLPRILAIADGATLRLWARVMLEELSAATDPRGLADGSAVPLMGRLESLLLDDPETSVAAFAQEFMRIVSACSAAPEDGDAVPVNRASEPGAPRSALGIADRGNDPSVRGAPRRDHTSVSRRRALRPRQPRREAVTVDSVLPFIVTGILARRNYFDGLRAALVCSDLLGQSACFAAALAYKLSPPPNRGWDRSVATRRLAAAMCGLDEPPDNAAMDGFIRGLSTACGPLDATLWVGNRAVRTQPGILVEKLDEALWAVVDIASSQPLGWFPRAEAVLRVADLLTGRLWWLAPGAADSGLPEALARRGERAVAFGVRPRLAGWLSAGDSCFTNEPLLRRRAAELRRVFDAAREQLILTHTELVELRPLVLPARGQTRRAAEYSIALAVCSALGDLGDTLWRDREPSQALLALRRFADLGGTVSVEDGRVLVRPALGRRFMDLREHGLLRDISGVPWWPGRRVEFAGP
jgi:hypothetical protein